MYIWLVIPVAVPTGLFGLERLQQIFYGVFGLFLRSNHISIARSLLVVVEIIIVANFGDLRSVCRVFWISSELFSGISGDFGCVKQVVSFESSYTAPSVAVDNI